MTESLRAFNTFGIDASCRAIFQYESVYQLRLLLRDVIGSEPFLHVGKGSNLLFVCEEYDGFVLHSRIRGVEVLEETDDTVLLRVGAGEDWDEFVARCVSRGWHGLENLSLIPGEVGASAVQNVGAYGVEAGDCIEAVETLCVETLEERCFTQTECAYAYRSSVFKHELKDQYIVTHVHYRLRRDFVPILTHAAVAKCLAERHIVPEKCTAEELREAVIEVRRSKLPDPAETGSAGSFFMNPVVTCEKAAELLHTYPGMPHYDVATGKKIPAAWLIEQCGWKGKKMGNAAVYDKQPLVLVNDTGSASGAEVLKLAQAIQADVKQRFGIVLSPEVLYIQ